MGKLAGAYSSVGSYEKTTLKVTQEGDYPAYFIGFTAPVTEVSSNYACSLCKGTGAGRPPQSKPGECARCNGDGKRIEKKVRLRYEMRHGIEEEVVTFKITAPGTYNGNTTKASTMYLRFRSLAELPQATPEEIDIWYSSLPDPLRFPCTVQIGYNDAGDALVIKGVRPRRVANGAPSRAAEPAQTQRPAAARETPPEPRREPDPSRFDKPATAAEPSYAFDEIDESEIPF